MVRTYKPKNRYQKWSKLSVEKTTFLIRAFFYPGSSIEAIAEEISVTARTVKNKYKRINDRILSDPPLATDLLDYLSPEADTLKWIFQNEHLSSESDFFDRLNRCFFSCPAERDVELQITDISYLAGLSHIKDLAGQQGIVTSIKVACAACPTTELKANVDPTAFMLLKFAAARQHERDRLSLRESFVRSICRSVLLVRAAAAKRAAASPELGASAYTAALRTGVRDLAVIAVSHLQRSSM